MNKIKINDLSPGEAVLSDIKIAEYRRLLERGEQFAPVEVYKVDNWLVVRNGNNRIRAFIEHCRANAIPLEAIDCIPSTAPAPGPKALNGLYKFSRYYGQGANAFGCMPIATNENYEATQTTVMREILSGETNE